MDRRDVYRNDEAWIAKYRAALEGVPVQPAGGMQFRTRLRNACKVVLLRLRKVIESFTVGSAPKSVPSSGPRPVQPKPVLQTDSFIRKSSPPEVNREPATKKTGTTVRPGPAGSTGGRPTQRQA